MAKQRYINTRFWSDSYADTLDPVEKLLFLYLLTNERTNVAGVYELPIKIMAVETGIEKNMVEKILKRFVRDGKIVTHSGWINIINSDKHQNTNNSKIMQGIKRVLDEVPQDIMSHLCLMHAQSHSDLDSNLDLNQDSDLSDSDESQGKDPVNLTLPLLKPLNPTGYKTWFRNKTQREAVKTLLGEFTRDQIEKKVELIVKHRHHDEPYTFPSVTTPFQLVQKHQNIKNWIVAYKKNK